MTIGGISGSTNKGAGIAGMGKSNMDSYEKNLQKQISNAQKELQELARNEEMDPQTKMKKRQEIQKQINDLNMQLRQHQMEERKKEQQEKQQTEKAGNQEPGLPKNSMEAVLSAGNSIKQAKTQGKIANQMQNEANIRRTEIKNDGGGSARTSEDNAAISRKWDDVESMEQKAQAATASEVSLLADVQNKLGAAAEGSPNAKTEEKNAEGGEKAEGTESAESVSETVTAAKPGEAASAAVPVSTKQAAGIGSNIDIKL